MVDRGEAEAGVEERTAEQNLALAFVAFVAVVVVAAVHANASFCSAPLLLDSSFSLSTLPSPCSSSLACGNGSQPEQAEAVVEAGSRGV